MDEKFDFVKKAEYSAKVFNASMVQGEGGVRDIVEGIPTRTKEKPYLACLMGLDSTSNVQHARWVVGGKLDAGIGFVATNLFPLAEKGLYLELGGSLASFSFAQDSSNFSTYLEVPQQLPAVAFYLSQDSKEREYVTWEQAKEGGVTDFVVRLVVVPISTKKAMVQVGAAPFTLEHLRTEYGEVYERSFFPNTMVRCSQSRTRLPARMGGKTTMLATMVDVVLEDLEGLGLGTMPFFYGVDFDPWSQEFDMPAYDVIKEALCCHMRAGLMPTAKSAGHLAEALAVALMADKDVRNLSPSVESPWPDFKAGGGGGAGVGGLLVEGWSFYR